MDGASHVAPHPPENTFLQAPVCGSYCPMTHQRPSPAPRTPQPKPAPTRPIPRAAREVEWPDEPPVAPPDPAPEPAPAPPPALAEPTAPAPPAGGAPAQRDAHGFDPAEYKWVPVRRKPRKDGWTEQRQRDFIAHLAESGSIEYACMRVDMSKSSAHRLRRAPGGEQFSAAWDVALEHAARVLLDTAFERAFNGSTEPVFDRTGARTGTRYRQNDRLLMFLLRAYMPGRFRHAHRDWRSADETLPPAPAPMEEVLRRLEPAPPPEPHRLLPPDELEDALAVADILDGELPHWHRGAGDAAPAPPVDQALEDELERARRDERETRENG